MNARQLAPLLLALAATTASAGWKVLIFKNLNMQVPPHRVDGEALSAEARGWRLLEQFAESWSGNTSDLSRSITAQLGVRMPDGFMGEHVGRQAKAGQCTLMGVPVNYYRPHAMTRGFGAEGDRGEIDAIAFDGRSAEWFLLMAKAQQQVVRSFGAEYSWQVQDVALVWAHRVASRFSGDNQMRLRRWTIRDFLRKLDEGGWGREGRLSEAAINAFRERVWNIEVDADYFDQDDTDAREISDAGIRLLEGVAGSHPLQATGSTSGVFGL